MTKQTPIRNVHTGDWLKSKAPTDDYRNGWDRIFAKKPPIAEQQQETEPDPEDDSS